MRSASGPDAEPSGGCLLIQVAAKEPIEVLRLANRAGSGLVFTGAGAVETVQAMRRHGWNSPMLTDRRRYAGAARVAGTAVFAQSWLADQRAAGIEPVLTDSGYIGDGDLAALRAVLGQAAEAGQDVTAILPLHENWLRRDRLLLIAEVVAHGTQVALVLEHSGDPTAAQETAAGLFDVLRNVPSAGLLGAGVAALAAVSHGAPWAAVGIRPALRTFPPVPGEPGPARRKRRWRPAAHEVLAAPVLSFRPADAVVRAYLAGSHPAWICRCHTCHGRPPDWLGSASTLAMDAHSFGVLLGIADRLRQREPGPAREEAWRRLCKQAARAYDELGLAALGWPPPLLMATWAATAQGRATAAPVQGRADAAPARGRAGAARAQGQTRAAPKRPRAPIPAGEPPLRSAG